MFGIGAHEIETLVACVDAGIVPDFWMKTMHHHGYWSARHPEWHDNLHCREPDETAAWTVPAAVGRSARRPGSGAIPLA